MSPHVMSLADNGVGFPRVSGDEPETMALPLSFQEFSPRERG